MPLLYNIATLQRLKLRYLSSSVRATASRLTDKGPQFQFSSVKPWSRKFNLKQKSLADVLPYRRGNCRQAFTMKGLL